jgi:serine/threonine protein kinase
MVVEQGPEWWVKIADFGISKRRHDATTMQTLQRGTMGFAAPEAVGVTSENSDGPYSSAVDMWSLGAVTFLMLTGQSAFQNFAELAAYCAGSKKFPAETLEKLAISGEGQDFVASLMMLAPEARPAAEEALQHPWMGVELEHLEVANIESR